MAENPCFPFLPTSLSCETYMYLHCCNHHFINILLGLHTNAVMNFSNVIWGYLAHSREIVQRFQGRQHQLKQSTRSFIQGSKLTFRLGTSWWLTEKFWSPTYFIYNLHKKHDFTHYMYFAYKKSHNWRSKTITRVTRSYKATVVLWWYVSGPKLMVV